MKKGLLLLAMMACFAGKGTAQCDVTVREAFGGISAAAVYNTYLGIGAIADAYVHEIYESEYVVTLMNEQIGLIDNLTGLLDASLAAQNALDSEDKTYVRQMKRCFYYLQKEAKGLSAYATSGSESAQQQYNENRDKAWAEITEMLGISTTEETPSQLK